MRRTLMAVAGLALLLAPSAQAQDDGQPVAQQQEQKKAKKPRPSRTLITREQIDDAVSKGATTAYDVVQRLHREWFRVRGDLSTGAGTGAFTPNRPYVFMDNTVMGDDPELLRQIKPESIAEIRFLSGPDATIRFGSGYTHGIIQVISSAGS